MAGAYWFCQVEAKTRDGYFLGFPACWNVVALYLYVLHRQVVALPGWFSIGVLLVLSVLTFVPTRYLYGTMGGRLNYHRQPVGTDLGRVADVDRLSIAERSRGGAWK